MSCSTCGGAGVTSGPCTMCAGRGTNGWVSCPVCGGRGQLPHPGGGTYQCGTCDGDGVVPRSCSQCGGGGSGTQTCSACNGAGNLALSSTGVGEDGDRLSRFLGVDPAALDGVQLALDAAGLVPGAGEPADALSALLSVARGDYVGAGFSAVSMVPLVGWGSSAAKWLKRLDDVPVSTVVDASVLRRVASGVVDPAEAAFFRQVGDSVEHAAASGVRAQDLDAVVRQAGANADGWSRALALRARAAAADWKDVTAHLVPSTLHDARTAGTKGVWDSFTGTSRAGQLVVVISGEVLDPLRDGAGRIVRAGLEKKVGLAARPGFDLAHLWGPQFGDEAAAGIMYAPRNFNRGAQRVLEETLAGVRARLEDGERLILRARATAFPPGPLGERVLRTADYDFGLVDAAGTLKERWGIVFDVAEDGRFRPEVVRGGLPW